MDPQALVFPNSHFADADKAMKPLIADRVCELSVECCHLRYNVSDKENENKKLSSSLNRMKTAVRRESDTLRSTAALNKKLESENEHLRSEVLSLQRKLLKAESDSSFQNRVLKNNRKLIAKLKSENQSKESVEHHLEENMKLKDVILSIQEELQEEISRGNECRARISNYDVENAKLQSTVCKLQSELCTLKNDTDLREKNMKEPEYCQAFLELEEAYEELHTKFENLWAEKNSMAESLAASDVTTS